jgi:hypothetical protein
MKHHFENHDLVTEGRAQLIDLTRARKVFIQVISE